MARRIVPLKVEQYTPDSHGLVGWSYDPVICSTSAAATSGLLYLARIRLGGRVNVTNIILHVATIGSGLTAGQSFAGLWTSAGALLGVTADQSTAWTTTGIKTMALVGGPYLQGPGDVYGGYWSAGTTPPAFTRHANSGVANVGLSTPNLRLATADSGLTTTAPSTLGAQSITQTTGWIGLS